jgi:hypothetical protein
MRRIRPAALLFAAAVLLAPLSQAQEPKKASKPQDPFAKITAGLKRVPADASKQTLFDLYWSEDRLLAALPSRLFSQKILMIGTLSSGLGQGRLLGGLPIGLSVLRFEKRGKKVVVMEEGTRFTAKPNTPTHAALAQGYPQTVLQVLPIAAPAPGGKLVVDVTGWLLRDPWLLSRVVSMDLSGAFRHDPSRSRMEYVKAFEENVELRYQAAYTGMSGDMPDTLVDPRFTTVSIHTSFHALPRNSYRPRLADPRVGYFMTVRRDFSQLRERSTYRRFINRWHLEKADPKAPLSAPKQPIVFYMEKTIPYEWRPYVRRGILAWNVAFEKAGFLDAIEVRQQQESDDWDPEDAKYNSVRWITSHREMFGAIGPSRVNPYTGQILDADVLVEASMVRNYWLEYQMQLPGYEGLDMPKDGDKGGDVRPASLLLDDSRKDSPQKRMLSLLGQMSQHGAGCACHAARGRQRDLSWAYMLGLLPSRSGATDALPKDGRKVPTEFLGRALQETVMHEIGHTLGLRHNFKASRWLKGDALHDAKATREHGLVGSVMDYNAINVAAPGEKQGEYFASRIGPYDVWAIRFGYTPFAPPVEQKALASIAAEGAKPGHDYGTDEDAMSWTGGYDAVDPYCATWDMGGDVFAFADTRYKIAEELLPKIAQRNVAKGEGYQLERYGVSVLLWQALSSYDFVARLIGGAEIRRDHKGDPGERNQVEPIPAADQRRALELVLERGLGDALLLSVPAEQLRRLHPSRWMHWGVGEPGRIDFSMAELAMSVQKRLLNRILHPKVLSRVQENELRTDAGGEPVTLPELYRAIFQGVFGDLGKGSVSIYRRNLQRALLDILIQQATRRVPGLSSDAQALARLWLIEIRGISAAQSADDYTKAHAYDLSLRAKSALEAALLLDR